MAHSLIKFANFITFPIRAITLYTDDKLGLSSLRSERFDYVRKEVTGYCLDIGCGKHNIFVNKYLNNNGRGIDFYPHEGLLEENIVQDCTNIPFENESFDTVTLIANLYHIPKSKRDAELSESYRCLKHGGNIIITMGNPVAEIIVYKLVGLYDKYLGTNIDIPREEYFLKDSEIIERLLRAGFVKITKKYFFTQWCLNHMLIGWKE